jgi:hypothetical protein
MARAFYERCHDQSLAARGTMTLGTRRGRWGALRSVEETPARPARRSAVRATARRSIEPVPLCESVSGPGRAGSWAEPRISSLFL